MHLRHVEMFCEVAKHRSFSKAAKTQNVSQSAASQSVLYLEKKLGTALIDRSVRPLGITAAGTIFLEGCVKLLNGFQKVAERVRQIEDRVVGRVKVASIYSVGLLLMDAYVKRYRELYPEAELELLYLHPDEVYEMVQGGQADLGIVSFPRDSGDIQNIMWQEQPFGLVIPPDHRFAKMATVSLNDLNNESFVGFTDELKIRRMIDRWLRKKKISVNVVHVFDNIENIKRAVEIGSGISILPMPTVAREIDIGTLQCKQLVDLDWQRPLGIIHRRHKSLTVPAEKFVELLHENPTDFPANRSTLFNKSKIKTENNDDRRSLLMYEI